MVAVLMLIIPIGLVVGVGWLSGRMGVLDEPGVSTFTRFTFYIAMPCQLFKDFSTLEWSHALNGPYMLAYGLTIAVIGTATFIASRRVLKDSIANSAINVMGTAQVNTACFAIPLCIVVFGHAAPVFPILLLQVTVLTVTILLLIEHDQHHANKSSIARVTTAMTWPLRNPIIVAPLIGLTWSALNWSYPAPIHQFLELMSGATAPLALFALGQSLYFDLKTLRMDHIKIIAAICTVKLLVFPLTAWVIGRYVF